MSDRLCELVASCFFEDSKEKSICVKRPPCVPGRAWAPTDKLDADTGKAGISHPWRQASHVGITWFEALNEKAVFWSQASSVPPRGTKDRSGRNQAKGQILESIGHIAFVLIRVYLG
jgi:hypothetical protein